MSKLTRSRMQLLAEKDLLEVTTTQILSAMCTVVNGVLMHLVVRGDPHLQHGQSGQDKTRQDKTRQDKTRQDKTRQDKTR